MFWLSQAFDLFKDYLLHSENKRYAWFLVAAILLSIGTTVFLSFSLTWWNVLFWEAISAYSVSGFYHSLLIFSGLLGLYVIGQTTTQYLIECLNIDWRNHLSRTLIASYLNPNLNYLSLSREKARLGNPDQRIQADVKYFVYKFLSLASNFLYSSLSLMAFLGTLWVVGGALSFTVAGISVVIPGYLVWISLAFTLGSSYVAHKIGHWLSVYSSQEMALEGDLRSTLNTVHEQAESVALEKGETYYKNKLNDQYSKITDLLLQKLKARINLSAYTGLYNQISFMLPYLIAAPLYFARQITMSQYMQIGYAFAEVHMAMNWFVNSYEELSECQANLARVMELKALLQAYDDQNAPSNIHINYAANTNTIEVNRFSLFLPEKTAKFDDMQFNAESTVIRGPSGYGKSTFFKALAGTWKKGEGEITLPADTKIYFSPQTPSIPKDTLRGILAYPDKTDKYDDRAYRNALITVGGGMEKLVDQLDNNQDWGAKWSGGEKQRIAFARILLKDPKWVFLDESTSSLDPDSEEHLYTQLKTNLTGATLISIAHRETVEKYHDHVVNVAGKADNEECDLILSL